MNYFLLNFETDAPNVLNKINNYFLFVVVFNTWNKQKVLIVTTSCPSQIRYA